MEDGDFVLDFPRPAVIYLYYEGRVPDEYVLTLRFEEERKEYQYHVLVIKLPEISAEELNDRKMVILIPFHLLKLRRMVKRYSSKMKKEEYVRVCEYICRVGNITTEDAYKLKRYTQ